MTSPRSRRERPAKPALTRAGIIAAAVAVLRAEGLAELAMRRLAQELDTGAASLYVYVRDPAELHAAVLDELLGEIDLDLKHTGWAQRLEAVLTSHAAVLFRYPGLAQSALVARPSGENYLRLLDTLLGLPPRATSRATKRPGASTCSCSTPPRPPPSTPTSGPTKSGRQ
ncbi:TetR/AcrR family transcriptional regulator [Amycolatopsis sp. FDAARGOS 1241]|uniref:TetR/AcrR family transcriptional regulator n=1 Tax=Amycolatopsis sp. FDAARGOS 1241 TaxID=2778070 RepID=UPI00351C9484